MNTAPEKFSEAPSGARIATASPLSLVGQAKAQGLPRSHLQLCLIPVERILVGRVFRCEPINAKQVA
jgi:hypothetical protein